MAEASSSLNPIARVVTDATTCCSPCNTLGMRAFVTVLIVSCAPVPSPSASAPIHDVPSYPEEDLTPLIEEISDDEIRALRRAHHPCAEAEIIGTPGRGSMKCARFVPAHPRLRPRTRLSYGAPVTMRLLERAAKCMDEIDPGGPPIEVWHVAKKTGGRTKVHLSHQNGLDVDLAFMLRATSEKLYEDPPLDTIDATRTWQLTQCLIGTHLVQGILMDWQVQAVVEAAAEAIGVSREQRKAIFQWPKLTQKHGLIRDEAGHRSHLHVRVRASVD